MQICLKKDKFERDTVFLRRMLQFLQIIYLNVYLTVYKRDLDDIGVPTYMCITLIKVSKF